ncbi:hypothetical protein ACH4Q6_30115 [Streptomyces lydicus]
MHPAALALRTSPVSLTAALAHLSEAGVPGCTSGGDSAAGHVAITLLPDG